SRFQYNAEVKFCQQKTGSPAKPQAAQPQGERDDADPGRAEGGVQGVQEAPEADAPGPRIAAGRQPADGAALADHRHRAPDGLPPSRLGRAGPAGQAQETGWGHLRPGGGMTMSRTDSGLTRRAALGAALGAAGLAAGADPVAKPDARRASPKRYAMKKSINLW